MASNSFGKIFKFTTWGESHGKALGCVIDGAPSLLELNEEYIQAFMDKRKPGQSKFTTQRQEPDQVEILSGVFEGKTTGTPISLIIYNQDQRSKDYGDIIEKFRPGHADYTYQTKYGIRDYRGGGRSSARETASRVAAGAVARLALPKTAKVRGALVQIGSTKIDRNNWDWDEVNKNPFFCPDAKTAKIWEDELMQVRKDGNSVGAVIEVTADGIPAGLGEPVYDKLDSDIARALMTINAVKGVEIGAGFSSAALSGEENADEMYFNNGNLEFSNNHAGGVLGGISSGQQIVARMVVKPTSSILKPRKTIDLDNNNTEIITKGRHDPCVGIRAVPVAEAMLAIVLADHYLRAKAYGTIK